MSLNLTLFLSSPWGSVQKSLKNLGHYVSLDAPLMEGENSNLYDVLNIKKFPNPDKALLQESLKIEIKRALQTLKPREADVVQLYFGLEDAHNKTLEEIAEMLHLSRERVRQIKDKSIRRLKSLSRCKILKTYLG